MIVKKYTAPTETDAVLKAKEELGSNAVVLNVKTLKQRGIFRLFRKDVVEITAALEEKEFAGSINAQKPSAALPSAALPSGQAASGRNFSAVADEKIDIASDSSVIEQKLNSLQAMLEQQMNREGASENRTSKEYRQLSEAGADTHAKGQEETGAEPKEDVNSNFKFLQLIYNKMLENEVNEQYANMIITEIENSIKKESNIDNLLSNVYQKIILKLGEPQPITVGNKPKILIFVGPTGVGKTTTIAKLASSYKLEKQCKVAFVTADTYRIAAVEQLNTYASIIDCPVEVIYASDEMETCFEELSGYDLIFVDTAGRSHKSEDQMLEIVQLYQNAKTLSDRYDVECYLTLSATTKYRDLVHIVDTYREIPDYKLIFTKLDETCSLGNILNIRLYTGAPLAYTTSGQNVPNDIELINEQEVAKQLLGGQ